MNLQKTFCMVFGMNLHLTVKSYSVLKYGINTKTAFAKYESLSATQKFRLEWLGREFVLMQDLCHACIGCQFDDVSILYGTKEDVRDAFIKIKGRREAITYTLKSNIKKHEDSGFIPTDKLIFKYFVDEYCPEYVILRTHGTQDLENLYDSPNFSWGRDKILKLMKYRDFFNTSKYLHLIETNEHHLST